MYDVTIIGSGPAGTSAAITCYNSGLKVLIISPKKEYSDVEIHPVQSVHPGVLTLMKRLGIHRTLLNSVKCEFSGIYVNGQLNTFGNNNEEWVGYHINKSKFNTLLHNVLNSSEIKVIESEIDKISFNNGDQNIKLTTNNSSIISSKFVIDASGSKRKIGRILNIKELFFSPPLTCRVGVSQLTSEQVITTNFLSKENGWVWFAPENKKQFTWNTLSVNKLHLNDCTIGKSKLMNCISTHNVRWRVFRPVFKNNVILCGDAAGILDPSAGQGILNALWSGIKAGNTIIESIRNPKMSKLLLIQYDQWFIKNYENKIEQLKEHYNKLNIRF